MGSDGSFLNDSLTIAYERTWLQVNRRVPRAVRAVPWMGHTKITTTDTYLNATTQLLHELNERPSLALVRSGG